jgi:hypothetical protein
MLQIFTTPFCNKKNYSIDDFGSFKGSYFIDVGRTEKL